MKTLFVITLDWENTIAECEDPQAIYEQALECAGNYEGEKYIDMYEIPDNVKYTCDYGMLCFYRENEPVYIEDYEENKIMYRCLYTFDTPEDVERISSIFTYCELKFCKWLEYFPY